MLNVTVTGASELTAKFAQMPARAHNRLYAAVAGSCLKLEKYIKTNKLEGQVLNHITGRLQSSIHGDEPPEDNGTTITGRVYSAGCNYAAIHEYGFKGTENVKEHIRTHLFGKEVAPFVVPAFVRNVNMPERSFLRSGLADMHDQIIASFQKAIAEAVK